MDPAARNQLLHHLSEGEDDSEEEEESYGGHGFQQQCRRRRKGEMKDGFNQEMQRVKMKRGKGGEVVHVNGGRIVRATGRKDRHSKVCTARGTRDRRVRLSPNTAIQFYDVQDRLGYDRPSKAIDWLMKEAKAEIDALNAATSLQQNGMKEQQCLNDNQLQQLNGCSNPSFSVFPMENAVKEPLLSSTDLHPNCLSFPDASSSSSSIFFFDDQRLISWNANPENGKPEEESFTNLTPHCFPPVIAQNQVFSQREPLQSSFFPHSFSYAAMGFANNDLSGLSAARRTHGDHTEEHHHLTSGRPTAAGTSLLDYQH